MKKLFLIFVIILSVLSTTIKYEFLDALKILEDDNYKNDKIALEQLKQLSLSDKNAAFLLGYYYKTKKFNHIDMTLSSKYYLQSAKLGDVYAMLIIGWNFYKGIGIKQDIKKGKQWLEKAAILGDNEAQELLKFIF